MIVVDEAWNTALAIVAHPDDLEYDGAGCALAKWTAQGKRVVELLATKGEAGMDNLDPLNAAKLRTEEQLSAAKAVGVECVEFLDHPDGAMEYSLALRRDLALAIRRHKPDVVVSINFRESWPRGRSFNHADHRVLGTAIIDAVRDAANRWIFPDSEDPAWAGVEFMIFANSPNSEHYVDVSEHLHPGISALLAHRGYLESLGYSTSGSADYLEREAELVGSQAGVKYAVSFEMIKP
jgi:LmbE family N-acetylglucosaminyl deacetylase